jgi:hypothetical protein
MPEFKENQGFKMKGPSIHKGTQKHMDAIEAVRKANIKVQKADASPAKGIFGGEFKETAEKVDKKIEKQEEKVNKATKGESKRYKKWLAENNMEGDSETHKQWKESDAGKKAGTWLGRTATRVKKGLQKGKLERLEKKKKKLEAKEAMTPEQRLAAKKERRTKIADQLEYIFLDGKRPDKLAAKRAKKAAKHEKKQDNKKLKNKEESQNKNTEHKEGDNTQGGKIDKKTNKIDWTKAPALNTQERRDWYTRHNLEQDDTTKLKEAK